MKITDIKKTDKQKLGPPLFTGPVIRRSPITDNEGSDLSIDYVYFPKGVRNKFHQHANDQVLVVIEGRGIIATKKKPHPVKVGDIIWIPAGEIHWHGASPRSKFAHISVTRANTKLTQIEK